MKSIRMANAFVKKSTTSSVVNAESAQQIPFTTQLSGFAIDPAESMRFLTLPKEFVYAREATTG